MADERLLAILGQQFNPTEPPDAPGGRWFYLSPQWASIIMGVLEILDTDRIWGTDPAQARQWLYEVMLSDDPTGECVDCPPEIPPCHNCQEYQNDDALVLSYAPTNPFINPTQVPAGYHNQPWTVWDESGSSLPFVGQLDGIGLEPGDVVTSMFSLPLVSLTPSENIIDPIELALIVATVGLPRFRVRVTGPGVLEIHLLKVPQGGYGYISIDGDINTSKIIDLSTLAAGDVADVFEAIGTLIGIAVGGGSLVNTEIVELPIEAGEHEIIVTMVPKISFPNFLSSGFGGGLRKVVFCRNEGQVKRPAPEPITPNNPFWRWLFDLCASQQNEWSEDECEYCECCDCCERKEDAMCRCGCNGGQNSVRFNPETGQMEYNNNGTWTPLPPTALPGESPVPTPSPDDVPSQGQECWKANGVWGTINRFLEAAFDVFTEQEPALINNHYWKFSTRYAGIGFRSLSLFGMDDEWQDYNEIVAFQATVNANLTSYMNDFVCAAQNRFSKSDRVTDDEIAWIRAYDFETGDADLDEFLNDVLNLPESETYRLDSYSAVQSEYGTCSCDGDTHVPEEGELEEGCYRFQYLDSVYALTGVQITGSNPQVLIDNAAQGVGTFAGGVFLAAPSTYNAVEDHAEARGGFLFELFGGTDLELMGATINYQFGGSPGLQYYELVIAAATALNDGFEGEGALPAGNPSGVGIYEFDFSADPLPIKYLYISLHSNAGDGASSVATATYTQVMLHLRKGATEFDAPLTIEQFCPPAP